MVISRRPRAKAALTRARAGETPEEPGGYTVETRERRAPREPEGPAEGIAGIIEALRGAGQVGIYRQNPTWARGHLQTLNLGAGESLDFEMLDQLQRYWGGGVYSFRPMNRGRFAGASQSVQFDGPTLYQGKPHPKDPDARRPVEPEVLRQNIRRPLDGGYPPPQYAAPYEQPPGMQRPSPELAMLGSFMERMMSRMDSMEAKLAGPGAAPAQAPDQIAGVLQTLKLAQQIGELWNPRDDDDDDEEEEGAGWEPKNPQEAMMAMALKKFDEDPDALGKLLGGKKATEQPGQHHQGVGPRLVRPEQHAAPPTAAPSPAGILAQLQQLDPAARAELFHQIGAGLDPETLAALNQIVSPPDSAAG